MVTAVRRVREDLGGRGEVEVDDLVPHADRAGATPGVVDFPAIEKKGANRGGDDAIPERPPGDGEQEGAVDAAGVGDQAAAEGAETLFEAHEPRV